MGFFEKIKERFEIRKNAMAKAAVIDLSEAYASKDASEVLPELDFIKNSLESSHTEISKATVQLSKVITDYKYESEDVRHLGEGGALKFREEQSKLEGHFNTFQKANEIKEAVIGEIGKYRSKIAATLEPGHGVGFSASSEEIDMTPFESISTAQARNMEYSDVKKIVSDLTNPDKINAESARRVTDITKKLYNAKQDYKNFAKWRNEGHSVEACQDGLGLDKIDAGLMEDYYEKSNHSENPPLGYLAKAMETANIAYADTEEIKFATKAGINQNYTLTDLVNGSTRDAATIMNAIGADTFSNFISMFKASDALKLADNEQLIAAIELQSVGDKDFLSATAVYDNGLPSGLKVKFEVQYSNKESLKNIQAMMNQIRTMNGGPEKTKLVHELAHMVDAHSSTPLPNFDETLVMTRAEVLCDSIARNNVITKMNFDGIEFHGQSVTKDDILSVTELQKMIANLPPQIQKTVLSSVNLTIDENGKFREAIIADGRTQENFDNLARGAVQSKMDAYLAAQYNQVVQDRVSARNNAEQDTEVKVSKETDSKSEQEERDL